MSIQTANGSVKGDVEVREGVSLLSVYVWARVLPSTPRLLSLSDLCATHGFRFSWAAGPSRP
eukprot:632614-Alexandrium_andersonii.AAC.1